MLIFIINCEKEVTRKNLESQKWKHDGKSMKYKSSVLRDISSVFCKIGSQDQDVLPGCSASSQVSSLPIPIEESPETPEVIYLWREKRRIFDRPLQQDQTAVNIGKYIHQHS